MQVELLSPQLSATTCLLSSFNATVWVGLAAELKVTAASAKLTITRNPPAAPLLPLENGCCDSRDPQGEDEQNASQRTGKRLHGTGGIDHSIHRARLRMLQIVEERAVRFQAVLVIPSQVKYDQPNIAFPNLSV